jgi:hypothetical protein
VHRAAVTRRPHQFSGAHSARQTESHTIQWQSLADVNSFVTQLIYFKVHLPVSSKKTDSSRLVLSLNRRGLLNASFYPRTTPELRHTTCPAREAIETTAIFPSCKHDSHLFRAAFNLDGMSRCAGSTLRMVVLFVRRMGSTPEVIFSRGHNHRPIVAPGSAISVRKYCRPVGSFPSWKPTRVRLAWSAQLGHARAGWRRASTSACSSRLGWSTLLKGRLIG